mmetsp:Transcript_4266/g.3105  ORF Transcript_4266/g.3105 Transcript_4266/m.3105 type:complete len:110 (+) Transcript_4266:558-887(+)
MIYDWDDTLLCTSLMNPNDEGQMLGVLKSFAKDINRIQGFVLSILKKSSAVGVPVIVTNARKGWVEFSSSLMMPKVYSYIMKHVKVYSARELFSQQYPFEMTSWKFRTF